MRQFPPHRLRGFCVPLVFGLLFTGPAFAQLTPDQQAEMLLSSARKAFNERNLPFAAARFREFVGKFGGHKEAASARMGLALSLLDGPEKDRNFGEIQQLLGQLAGDKAFPEQAQAAYQLGHSWRAQGMAELASVFVDERYENQGIGAKLIHYTEGEARRRGIAKLFCLSTQAINYFVQKGGYKLGSPDDLPPARREKYEQHGRNSQVLVKALV